MTSNPKIRMWVAEPPGPEVKKALEQVRRAPDIVQVAVMPDVHPAAGGNNGVVMATNHLVYPAAVGGDIGCGYTAVALKGDASPLDARSVAGAVLDDLARAVPVMRHRRRDCPYVLPDTCASEKLSSPELMAKAAEDGKLQLGTLGRGNHFLECQRDEDELLWVMVHSGSRAMGQFITAYHLRLASSAGSGPAWLDLETAAGQAYLNDVEWARAYASASRRHMLDAAVDVLARTLGVQADEATLLGTDHNHVQREMHGGQVLWVHRKGANAAAAGSPNLIPGSMGTATFHVQGRGHPDALCSSSHGAGRAMSRQEARSRIRRRDFERQMEGVWYAANAVSRLIDEAPKAYKDLDKVMRAQRDLVRIARRLRPVLNYKGL